MEWIVAATGLILFGVIWLGILLKGKVARLNHEVHLVKTRLREGGVELVEDIKPDMKLGESWKDLDETPEEELDEFPRARPNRLTGGWFDA